MDDNDDGNVIPFAERETGSRKRGPQPPDDATETEAVAPGDAYATVTGQRLAHSLEFIYANGDSFTLPYSYRPLLWWTPPSRLVMEYPGFFSVALAAESLAGLFRRIRDQKVIWIREIPPAKAAGLITAVTSIKIIRVYPSRDGELPG